MIPPTPATHWLAGPLRANARLYGEVAVAAALINLFGLATSLFSMTVYDRVVPANATNSLIALSIGMALILAFDFTLRTLRGLLIDHAGARVDRVIGDALFARVLALPLGQRRGSTGAFTARLREYETLRDFLASATLTAVVDVPFALLFLVVAALIGGPLALVPLAMLPLVLGTAFASQRALTRLTARALDEGLSKQGVLVETVGALETVRSVGAGPMLMEHWRRAVVGAAAASLAQRSIAARAANVAISAQTFAYVGTVALGVGLVGEGALTTGAVVACSLLAGRVVAPLGGVANLLVRLAHARAAYRALDPLMRSPLAAASSTDTVSLTRPVSATPAAVELAHVRFAYPHSPGPIFADLSLRLAAGERVALLGCSGSGKSTLTRLLLGLHVPQAGLVRVGGSDPAAPHAHAAARTGACPQETTLFTGTVGENIALGRPGVDEAAVERAVMLAGVDAFLGPAGLDRLVTDRGEGWSGGQRQAIALARALASDPALLILDEPTSAMDAVTETALIDRLAPALAGRTLILVTHRAPLLRLVDRVIVLEAGRIALDGPRDAVLRHLSSSHAEVAQTRAAA